MFNIGPAEIVVLIIIGVIFFGPEQLPDIARKLARVVKYLQQIANGAKETLAEHVGPEFADLELSDLTPQKLAAKYLGEAMREIEEVKSDLAGVKSELGSVAEQTSAAVGTPITLQTVKSIPEPPPVADAPTRQRGGTRNQTTTARIRKVKAANRVNRPQTRSRKR